MQRRQIRFNAGPDDVDVLGTVQRGVLLPAWLDVVSGSADSAICDAVAFLVRLRRGKYPGIAEAVVPVMGNQGPVFWVELNCLRAREFALAEEEEGWWWWLCVLWEKEGKGTRER